MDQIQATDYSKFLQSKTAAIVVLLAFGIAQWFYAGVNDGFYQGEEGAHYINMKEFWENPGIIMGNWAKTGWKIFMVIPGLLGKNAVLAASIIISMATAWLCFLYTRTMGMRFPILVIFLLMCQTFWFSLAFRPICEPTAAFFLILACLLHQRTHLVWAALSFSYALTIRQELYIPGMIYGIYLLTQKNWRAAFSMATFPILYNLLGWWASGDPFYLFSNAFKAADFANKYMRPGFDHYIQMSPLVFGWIGILSLSAYFIFLVSKKIKPDWIILIPLLSYWFLECLYSMKSFQIGAATAGNLRYLLVISPLVAVLGNYALDKAFEWNQRKPAWIVWTIFLGVMIYYNTYEHNYLEYGRFKDHIWKLMIPGCVFLVFYFIKIQNKFIYTLSLMGVCILSLVISQTPLKLSNRDENSTCKEIADYCLRFNYHEKRTIYQSMPMFAYFIDRTPKDFPKGLHLITEENLLKSPVGSIIIWDSHYAANYGPVDYTWFEDRPDKFLAKIQTESPDKKVDFIIYERINQ
ncbi:MAG: hypothetical protein IPO62_01050 [Saprospiraceae bacterium]|nr:hypothetical protein [Saprospiraceae bacterium]MBK9629650.1 hypothetical protein [Saprospiraceae bacterium]